MDKKNNLLFEREYVSSFEKMNKRIDKIFNINNYSKLQSMDKNSSLLLGSEYVSAFGKMNKGMDKIFNINNYSKLQSIDKENGLSFGSAIGSEALLEFDNTFKVMQNLSKKYFQPNKEKRALEVVESYIADVIDTIVYEKTEKNLEGNGKINVDNSLAINEQELINKTECKNWQNSLVDKWVEFKKRYPAYAIIITIIVPFMICEYMVKPLVETSGVIIKESFSKINMGVNISDIKKEINNMLCNEFSLVKNQIISTYRYIESNKAVLRRNRSMNAYILISLDKGEIVEILKKNKHWIYIKYEDENHIVHKGWINTIYTKRIE